MSGDFQAGPGCSTGPSPVGENGIPWDALAALEASLGTDGAAPPSGQEREERLAADARLVEALRAHNFDGPLYRRFNARLLEYGRPTLLRMLAEGSIFRHARKLGRPVPPHTITLEWTRQERTDLATDSALAGLQVFREHALVRGKWQPDGGANLTTFYTGAAIRSFPRLYRKWFRDRQNELRHAPDSSDYMQAIPDQRGLDPAVRAVINDEAARMLRGFSGPARTGLVLRAVQGYTTAEAAEELRISAKALESQMGRGRTRLRTLEGPTGHGQEGETR